MKEIWAPWRIQYIETKKPQGCIFCDKPKENDDVRNYILFRGEKSFVMLNSFPYNPGHLLIAPYRHVATLEDLAEDELLEHWQIVCRCLQILRQELKPEGLNVGLNLGRVAGAGVDKHMHTHIVPRWNGDTNFMPVLADVRIMPQALADTYSRLKPHF
jgi:ATP adenylyltransferase